MDRAHVMEPEAGEQESHPAGEIPVEIEGVLLTETAATVASDLSRAALDEALRAVAERERGAAWWVGDILAFGETKYGVTYAEAAEATGLSVRTLYNRARLSRKVPPEVRLPERELAWGMHRPVAPLADPDRQAYWLDFAVKTECDEAELAKAIKAFGRDEGESGDGGYGAFSRGGSGESGGEFPDPLAGKVTCPTCGGHGEVEPEVAAMAAASAS